MYNFIQGENVTFYMTFNDSSNNPIPNGISGTNISVSHLNYDGNVINDIVSGTMTQTINPSTWFYPYTISGDALITTYSVIYDALLSGNHIQRNDTYAVLPSSFNTPYTIQASGSIIDPTINVPVSGASIVSSNPDGTYSAVYTDGLGRFQLFTNPGYDTLTVYANGYYIERVTFPISSGSLYNFNVIDLYPIQTSGSLIISDTYVYQCPNYQTYMLPNLKVSLYDKLDTNEAPPYAVSYTNASGTFFMRANPGQYVLNIQGDFWNPYSNRNNRYDYTYDIEVNGMWSGTGRSGTSSPYNFQYKNTSRYSFLR